VADAWFVNPHNRLDTIERQMGVYKQALWKTTASQALPEDFPMMREVFVAKSRDEAMRLAEPYLKAKYDAYHEWGQAKAMPKGDNDLGMMYEDLVKDRFLFGSPEEISEQIIDIIHADSASIILSLACSIRACRSLWCWTKCSFWPKKSSSCAKRSLRVVEVITLLAGPKYGEAI
jgi:alkanesulfonate monooxygenase SsuD/methylene tetrahydromethanopterin reductase-like flavin-dependent oxidoreductase (luciferase family)